MRSAAAEPRDTATPPPIRPVRWASGAGRVASAAMAALVVLGACELGPESDAEPGDDPGVLPSAADTTASAAPTDTGAAALPMADSAAAPAPRPDTAGEAGAAAAVAGGEAAAPATSLDSLRLDVLRLSAAVEASNRSVDSVVGLLARGETPAPSGEAGPQESTLQDAAETARSYGVRAFWAMVVLMLTFFAVRVTVYALTALSERSAERRLFFKRLVPLARILLWAFAVYFVVRVVFAVDAQGLFAAAAAIGVAIGFAAQDLLKNIFGGLVIVFDQPFQVGDKIQVGDSYGEVVSIGLRSTRIVTPEDSLVSVPNAQVVDSQVSNANSGALDCQVVTELYLPGFIDEARAKAIAYQAAASSRYIYLQKPIVVLVEDEFRETFATRLKVKAYVMDARHEALFRSDVTERARAEFRRQGLTPAQGPRGWAGPADPRNGGDGAPAPRDPAEAT